VYASPLPRNLEELKEGAVSVKSTIGCDMLQGFWDGLGCRVDGCRVTGGVHTENLQH
jgi:hypothetical protein